MFNYNLQSFSYFVEITGDITAKRVEMVDRGKQEEEMLDLSPSQPQFWSKGSFERILILSWWLWWRGGFINIERQKEKNSLDSFDIGEASWTYPTI